jgi:glycosyltransferase involved in cell wall biosynthesis
MTRPQVIMLLSRHPYAERSGRAVMLRQRIEQIRRLYDPVLVVLGHPTGAESDAGLVFLPMAAPPVLALNALRLARLPMQTWLYYSASSHKRIARLLAETNAQAVYVDMLRLAPLARALNTALIVDYDDLLSARYQRARGSDYDVMGFLARRVGPLAPLARVFAKHLLAAEGVRCARYERDVLDLCDLALFTSAREAAVLGGDKVMGAPPLMGARPPVAEVGRRLIFLGNMHYAENVTMLRALADAVRALDAQDNLPTDAQIEVVGDYPLSLAESFDRNRIQFLGRVDDLASLAGEGIFLAPVTSGSGVKLKVLDGLSLGCPVVGTAKAFEGLSLRGNRDALIAADPVAVLRTAIALRERTRLKTMLAKRGQDYVRRVHALSYGDGVGDAVAAAIARRNARQDTL